MRLRIHHETRFRYDAPAFGAIQMLRLTPRNDGQQFIRRWRIEIDANARLTRQDDPLGNITHIYALDDAIDGLTVTVDGEIDTAESGGVMRGVVERLPVGYFLGETGLTRPSDGVRRHAAEIFAAEAGDRLAFLHALLRDLHAMVGRAAEGVAEAQGEGAAAAFAARAGTAREMAHVFVAAARSVGVPARFVAGYLFAPELPDQTSGHAWAEAHVDRLGWVGFDVREGLCVGPRHVRIAIGRDGLEAAPIRSAYSRGGHNGLDMALRIAQGRTIVDA